MRPFSELCETIEQQTGTVEMEYQPYSRAVLELVAEARSLRDRLDAAHQGICLATDKLMMVKATLSDIANLSSTTGLTFEDQSFAATRLAQEALSRLG